MMRVFFILLLLFLCSVCSSGEQIIDLQSNFNQSQLYPKVAYDWKNDLFMVTWEESVSYTEKRIRVLRMHEDGSIIGDIYSASQGDGGIRTKPDIVHDPHTGAFFVVYVLNDTAIWGRLCYSTGSLGPLINIVSGSDTLDNPSVTYDPVLRQFLVAYECEGEHTPGTISSQILVQRVTASGTKASGPLLVSELNTSKDAYRPDIASVGGQSMVVWQESLQSGNVYDIKSIMLENGAISSGILPIATDSYDNQNPSIAANERTEEYMIVYQARPASYNTYGIYGRMVQGNAVRYSTRTIETDSSNNLQYPSVAYDQMKNEFVTAWMGRETAVIGSCKVEFRRINAFGSPTDLAVEIESYGGMYSALSHPSIAISDTDVVMIPYRKNWMQTAYPLNKYYDRICVYNDEYCIDADINCDGEVNIQDFQIVAENWLMK